MQQITSSGCTDHSAQAPYVGIGASVDMVMKADGEWQHGLELDAETSVRIAQTPEEVDGERYVGDTMVPWTVTATLGWHSRYVGARAGLYFAIVKPERPEGAPAGSLRFGNPRNLALRLSLFDQPQCFASDCILGAEVLSHRWGFGGSVGLASGRVFGQLELPDVAGDLDLHMGIDLGMVSENGEGGSAGILIGVGDD